MNIYLQLGMVMFLLVMVRAAQQISVTGYHWWRIPVIGLAFAYLSVWEFGNLRHVFEEGMSFHAASWAMWAGATPGCWTAMWGSKRLTKYLADRQARA